MEIQCPKCETVYEVEEEQLRGGASTLKCSQCQYLFRVQSEATLSRETQQRWMLEETQSGDVRYFTTFEQLRDWIVEGRVAKRDSISRTGKKWKRLGEIGEFEPLFSEAASRPVKQQKSTDPSSGTSEPKRSKKKTRLMVEGDDFQSSTGSNERITPPIESKSDDSDVESGRDIETGSDWELGNSFGAEEDQSDDEISDIDEFDQLEWENDSNSKAWLAYVALVSVLLFVGAGMGVYFGFVPGKEIIFGRSVSLEKLQEITSRSKATIEDARTKALDESNRLVRDSFGDATDSVDGGFQQAVAKASKRAEKLSEKEEQNEKEPLSIGRLVDRGQSALENGDTQRAEQLFARVIDRDSGNAEAITGMGWVYIARGNPAEAVKHFQKSIRLNPDYGDAYIGMGKARRKVGQRQKAIEAYETYISKHPEGPQASIAKYQLEQLKD